MTDDGLDITVAIEGDITLENLADGFRHIAALIQGLTRQFARNAGIVWTIEDLRSGSAIATIGAQTEDVSAAADVIAEAMSVAHSLESHGQLSNQYSESIVRAATNLAGMVDGRVRAVSFHTASDDAVVTSHAVHAQAATSHALGAVAGRIETLTARRGLRFVLYDSLFDRAVNCYITADQQEHLRGLWGDRVVVDGVVTRDRESGHPIAIRDIRDIHRTGPATDPSKLPVVLPGSTTPNAVETIRRVRDAW